MNIEIKQEIKLLDFVLSYFPQTSVTKAKKMIMYNCFYLSGASIKSFEYILHKGDTVEYRKYSGGMRIAKEKRSVTVIYEDRDIIVINKSSFQTVVGATEKNELSLTSELKKYLKRKYHNNEVYLIFAPQKDECGLCIFAKNKLARNWLEKQKDSFNFTISAIVTGDLKHKNDKKQVFIAENNGIYSVSTADNPNAKKVILNYKTKESWSVEDKNYYLIEIYQTGCSAWLNRLILSDICGGVVADGVFKKQKYSNNTLKYCIHSVQLLRPSTNKKLTIACSLPHNFTKLNNL
ncbi:MAG: hypothetical protein IJ250_00920 [Bacteroidales bacterium]|nr:hypothetical protein [Bacteroidales bacterium]